MLLTTAQDYSLRAKDFNEKKNRLKILRQKAAERNPDEFHFGMMSSKTHRSGEKIADRGNKPLSHDVVKLLKTQDAGYLQMTVQKTQLARRKLEQDLALLESIGVPHKGLDSSDQKDRKRAHLAYVDSVETQKAWEPTNGCDSIAATAESDLEQEVNEEPAAKASKASAGTTTPKEAKANRRKRNRLIEAKRNLLEAMKARERDLMTAQRELEVQRAKMNNAIGGTAKNGKSFKIRERKR